MKLKKDLKPWEVMKAHAEGARIACCDRSIPGMAAFPLEPAWRWDTREYFVIDETAIDWGAFDWDFFKQYGGLPALVEDGVGVFLTPRTTVGEAADHRLRRSPWYYWDPLPSKQDAPVPPDVWIVLRHNVGPAIERVIQARDVDWGHPQLFRITDQSEDGL